MPTKSKPKYMCFRNYLILFFGLCISSVHAQNDFTYTKVCQGDTTVFINTSAVSKQAHVYWDLDFDGFFNDGAGDTAKFVYENSGTFYARLKIVDSNSIEHMSEATPIIVEHVPLTDFTYQFYCEGDTTQLINITTIRDNSALQFEWFFNSSTTRDATSKDVEKDFGGVGSYQVKLKTNSSFGCTSSKTETINILQKPKAAFTFTPSCSNNESLFHNQSSSTSGTISDYIWRFGDGVSLSFLQDEVSHAYQSSGTFAVTLKAIADNGCTDSLSQEINIAPNASYSYQFFPDSFIFENTSTTVEVDGDFTNIIWDNNSTSSQRTFNEAGEYYFTVYTEDGCSSTQSLQIGLKPAPPKLQRANDFLTPNNDGKNDVLFFPNLSAHQPCTLRIYDMNSLEVLNEKDYQNNWDGTVKGGTAPAGAYYYFLKCNGQEELKGNTNLIR